jgi:nitrate reductase gamma subunit
VTLAVYFIVALAAAVFAAACAWRAIFFARSPLHLRWELYPVPHEAPERASHGGSFFEQSEWWRQPRQPNLAGELRFMVPEMLFLRALWAHNRPLWYRSFPFHFGLYLLAGTLGLVFAGAVTLRLAGDAGASFAHAVQAVGAVTGAAGLGLSLLGAIGLLHRRLTDPALRVSTTPGDLFNLAFFIGAFVLLAAGYWTRSAGAPGALALASGIVHWDASLAVPPFMAAGIVAAALLAAYVPLTHMSHFIAKYFTYHSVRWDDEPLAHNAKRARIMAEYLSFRPTWSAGHIRRAGEARTWAEVVADNPAQESKR